MNFKFPTEGEIVLVSKVLGNSKSGFGFRNFDTRFKSRIQPGGVKPLSRVRQSVTPDRRPQSGVGRRLCRLVRWILFWKYAKKGLHKLSPKLGMFLTDRRHYHSWTNLDLKFNPMIRSIEISTESHGLKFWVTRIYHCKRSCRLTIKLRRLGVLWLAAL